MKFKLESKLPSKAKTITYLGLLLIVLGLTAYIYSIQAQKKEENKQRLQELIAQSGGDANAEIASNNSLPVNAPQANSPVAPAQVDMPPLSEDITTLLDLGKQKAKEQAQLALEKVQAERKKASNDGAGVVVQQQGGFLLSDEMPASGTYGQSGVSFNERATPERQGINSLEFRYASRIDGKLIAYVSIGEKGRMVEAKQGSIIEGIKITSISETQLCATQGKTSRCISN
ncbi:hypothetical protein BTN33_22795 [Aeromonas veronii]|uniref:hypothetical protein n=1 Tax=Aeromonas veronii TaxID=654 RepID=UPI000946BB12|nr:hypothetical protein [Aeromonas veronii]OLF56818.1 hypothetical protein BTN33_22795 [Aeromonas veronii]